MRPTLLFGGVLVANLLFIVLCFIVVFVFVLCSVGPLLPVSLDCQLLCLRPVFCGSNIVSISGLSILVCLSMFSYVYLWTLQCEWDKKKELVTLLASRFAPVFGRLHHAKIFSFLWCIFCFVCLRSVPCARYYPGIWIFHSWLPLRFSLIFISIAYLPWIPNDRKLYNAKCLKSIWNSLVIWSKARNQFRV